MQINVSLLLKLPIGTTRAYTMSEIVDTIPDDNGRLIQGPITLLRTHRGILVKGTLRTEAEVTCSRCLRPFRYPLSLNIEEEYIPVVDIISGAPLPPPDEPDFFTISDKHIIDLTEAIRQYTELAIPMKPLCDENCAGLYQECSHNLNQEPCECPAPARDPRWSNLIELLPYHK